MPIDPQIRQSIAAHFAYLRDLGIFDFYRRGNGMGEGEFAAEPALAALLRQDPLIQDLPIKDLPIQDLPATEVPPVAPVSALPAPAVSRPAVLKIEESAIPPNNPFPSQPSLGSYVAAEGRAAALQVIRNEIGDCTRCALAAGRNKIVFGDGDPNARLFFVGEGPGADEDAQGLPFVGRAGQLLNNMIAAMGLKREQVYIANIVKCRPPQNRVPEPEEAHTCSPFLFRQIDIIRPQVLVALGSTAALYLLGVKSSLSGLRGRVHQCRGSKLIVTYHPAYLLRDPRQKKEAWRDLQLAMTELGLSSPAQG